MLFYQNVIHPENTSGRFISLSRRLYLMQQETYFKAIILHMAHWRHWRVKDRRMIEDRLVWSAKRLKS